MKTKNNDHNQLPDSALPDSALRAFEDYPQIAASPDFNRRVLERVFAERQPSRFDAFCDRLDEIFARPVLKLLGAATMGAVVALIGTGVLLAACSVSTPAVQGETPPVMAAREPDTLMADSLFLHNRMAWARDEGVPFEMQPEYFAPREDKFQTPARREKSGSEMEDKRSSSCPAAFRSLV
jgi:hypothetical protein